MTEFVLFSCLCREVVVNVHLHDSLCINVTPMTNNQVITLSRILTCSLYLFIDLNILH